MILSDNAKARWGQRCHGLDFYDEYTGAKRAGKSVLNKLRKGWERGHGVGSWPAHHEYLVSTNGVVFIIGDSEGTAVLITVLRTKELKQWRTRATIDDRLRRKHAL